MSLANWSIPRNCWSGETAVILGGGPSLTQGQVDHCRGRCPVVAINRAYVLAPWADWLWGCDPGRFWIMHSGPLRLPGWPDALKFEGTKITVSPDDKCMSPRHERELPRLVDAGLKVIRHAGADAHHGVSRDPAVVRGNNSAFQLLSVLHFTGVRKTVLLGIDMGDPKHWHDGYPGISHPKYAVSVVPKFQTLVDPLAALGVDVVNCSPGSALTCFRQAGLVDEVP